MSYLGFSPINTSSGGPPSYSDVITALTFTPVNKAGDTMTGALNVPSLGVNGANTSSKLNVIGDGEYSFYGGGDYAKIYLQRASGTSSSPAAIGSLATMGGTEFRGYDGSSFATGGYIRAVSTQAWTGSAHGTRIEFGVTPNDSTTASSVMSISQNGAVSIGVVSSSYPFYVAKTYTDNTGGTMIRAAVNIDATTTPGSGSYFAQYMSVSTAGSGANDVNTINSTNTQCVHAGTGVLTTGCASYFLSDNSAGGTVTGQRGAYIHARNNSSGAVTTQIAAYCYGQAGGSGNVSSSYGSYNFVQNTGSGIIAAAYGTYTRVANTGTGAITNGYGLYVVGSTSVTNAWGVYQAGSTDKNYFAANVGIGSYNSPQAKLHIDGGTATASNLKFTAGSTTGQTSTDGFDIGVTTTGEAEIRQRENLDLVAYTNNAEVLRLKAAGNIQVPTTVTAAGNTANQTINKVSGTVNFAAGGSSRTVTNSLVTANSIVFAVVRSNDSTAAIKNVVPTAGSFTINLTASATAETSVGFFVIN